MVVVTGQRFLLILQNEQQHPVHHTSHRHLLLIPDHLHTVPDPEHSRGLGLVRKWVNLFKKLGGARKVDHSAETQ